jgi:hypothetical protein
MLNNNSNNANSVTYFKSLENNYPIISSHQQSQPNQFGEVPQASPYYWKNEGGIINNHSTMKDATSKQMLRKKNKTSIENLATWQQTAYLGRPQPKIVENPYFNR